MASAIRVKLPNRPFKVLLFGTFLSPGHFSKSVFIRYSFKVSSWPLLDKALELYVSQSEERTETAKRSDSSDKNSAQKPSTDAKKWGQDAYNGSQEK